MEEQKNVGDAIAELLDGIDSEKQIGFFSVVSMLTQMAQYSFEINQKVGKFKQETLVNIISSYMASVQLGLLGLVLGEDKITKVLDECGITGKMETDA